ncbi:unnamed protein product [Moneuplotes crassus]|uniref:Uncharacterized protein n=1 Tax=Euplotes crassus TaxID=5936 RepID=A0AAD1XGA0_EUPCR|nr:unnamed protein product [Moneuplotes crassus]
MISIQKINDRGIMRRKPPKKILKLKKRKKCSKEGSVSRVSESSIENPQQKLNKHVRFQGIIESIDKISQAGEDIENSTGESIEDTASESSVRLSLPKQEILDKLDFDINNNEQVKVPKYELVMVLRENENLRNKILKYKDFIHEMRKKMEPIKHIIINYEIQREEGMKQVDKLKREVKSLKKLLSQSIKPDRKDSSGEIIRLKKELKRAYLSNQGVDQCAQLGKEIISLQLKLDKQKTLTDKYKRERSFSKTIEKVASDIGSVFDTKSNITMTPIETSTRSWSREDKTRSSDDLLNPNRTADLRVNSLMKFSSLK